MSKSGGGFSIGTIIFVVIIGYNFLFDDDDEKEVQVIEQAEEMVVDAEENIKPKDKGIITSVKEKLREARDSEQFKVILEKVNNAIDGTDEKEEIIIEDTPEVEPELVEEKSTGPPPKIVTIEPKDEQPQTNNFEKL
jgi:hypothetical protein